MLLGGDASDWVELSTSLGPHISQIFVPREIDAVSLRHAGSGIDVLIVVTSEMDPDPCAPVRVIREAGLQRRTVVLAARDDQRTAAEALAHGVAGYLRADGPVGALADAVLRVARGGAVFDPPAAAVLHNRSLKRDIGDGSYLAAARALASALEMKDTYTGGHAERVTALAVRLARTALYQEAMPSEALEAAFLLHDVGKIGIPESILLKSGGITDTERRVLNTHPILGERIVAPLGFPEVVRHVIRHHHERWDGSGYPDALRGYEIPGAARIFAIADVIDAMTSIRPYRKPVTFERAIEEVVRNAGRQFDPDLVAIAQEAYLDVPAELVDPLPITGADSA